MVDYLPQFTEASNFVLTRDERDFMEKVRDGKPVGSYKITKGARTRLMEMDLVGHIRSPRQWFLTPKGTSLLEGRKVAPPSQEMLLPAQLTLLKLIKRRGWPINPNYAPARVLISLGMARWSEAQQMGAKNLMITKTGVECIASGGHIRTNKWQ